LALLKARAPAFIQEYLSYEQFRQRGHSHRWIVWEFYNALPALSDSDHIVRETVAKQLSIPVNDCTDFDTSQQWPNSPPPDGEEVQVFVPINVNRDIYLPTSLCASIATGSVFMSLIVDSGLRPGFSFTSAWNEHKAEASTRISWASTLLGALATEPEPIATEFAAVAEALGPMAVASGPVATAPSPKAAPPFDADANEPTATEPVAVAPTPMATALTPVAWALRPTAMAPGLVAFALSPSAIEEVPRACEPTPPAKLPDPQARIGFSPVTGSSPSPA